MDDLFLSKNAEKETSRISAGAIDTPLETSKDKVAIKKKARWIMTDFI